MISVSKLLVQQSVEWLLGFLSISASSEFVSSFLFFFFFNLLAICKEKDFVFSLAFL